MNNNIFIIFPSILLVVVIGIICYLLFYPDIPSYLRIPAITFLSALIIIGILLLSFFPYLKKADTTVKDKEVKLKFETTNK